MKYIIFFIICIIIINLAYYLFVIRKSKALNNMKKAKDVILLTKLNKINIDDYDLKKVVRVIGFGNSIIVSTIGTLALLLDTYIKEFYLWLLITAFGALLLLVPTILIIYKLIGNYIKGGK